MVVENIHHLYVKHLLNGKGFVTSSGGTVLTFAPMHGGGWFGDKLKSAWGHTKNFFSNHVQPVIVSHGRDALKQATDSIKYRAKEALNNDVLSSEPLSIRERLTRARGNLKDGLTHDLKGIKQDHQRLLRDHILSSLK